MSALAALTSRTLSGSRRDADLLFAALAPVGCFLGFTLVLGSLIHPGSMTYPQYVLPVVIVQAMLFGAMTTADRAARDRLSGFGSRLKTLPVPAAVPLAARMLYCLIRSVVALVAAVAVGWSFGFRMAGGPGDTGLFVIIVVAFAMAVCLGADALGSRVGSVESSSQLLLLPQLVLVLLSTGIAPAGRFRPGWARSSVTSRSPGSPRRCADWPPVTQRVGIWRWHRRGAWGCWRCSVFWRCGCSDASAADAPARPARSGSRLRALGRRGMRPRGRRGGSG